MSSSDDWYNIEIIDTPDNQKQLNLRKSDGVRIELHVGQCFSMPSVSGKKIYYKIIEINDKNLVARSTVIGDNEPHPFKYDKKTLNLVELDDNCAQYNNYIMSKFKNQKQKQQTPQYSPMEIEPPPENMNVNEAYEAAKQQLVDLQSDNQTIPDADLQSITQLEQQIDSSQPTATMGPEDKIYKLKKRFVEGVGKANKTLKNVKKRLRNTAKNLKYQLSKPFQSKSPTNNSAVGATTQPSPVALGPITTTDASATTSPDASADANASISADANAVTTNPDAIADANAVTSPDASADANAVTSPDANAVISADANVVTTPDASADSSAVTSPDASPDASAVTSPDASADANVVTSADASAVTNAVTSPDASADANAVISAVTTPDASADANAVISADANAVTNPVPPPQQPNANMKKKTTAKINDPFSELNQAETNLNLDATTPPPDAQQQMPIPTPIDVPVATPVSMPPVATPVAMPPVATQSTPNSTNQYIQDPLIKTLSIYINPNIPFSPKMLDKTAKSSVVNFDGTIQLNPQVVYEKPPTEPRAFIYNKFFDETAFHKMVADSVRGLTKGQTYKTLEEAKRAGIIDKNIMITLNTLFATDTVIYINGQPYTIYAFSWNGEWQIDTKLPKNLEQGPSMYRSDLYNKYTEEEKQSATSELNLIPKNVQMSDALTRRVKQEIAVKTAPKPTTTSKEPSTSTTIGSFFSNILPSTPSEPTPTSSTNTGAPAASNQPPKISKRFISNLSELSEIQDITAYERGISGDPMSMTILNLSLRGAANDNENKLANFIQANPEINKRFKRLEAQMNELDKSKELKNAAYSQTLKLQSDVNTAFMTFNKKIKDMSVSDLDKIKQTNQPLYNELMSQTFMKSIAKSPIKIDANAREYADITELNQLASDPAQIEKFNNKALEITTKYPAYLQKFNELYLSYLQSIEQNALANVNPLIDKFNIDIASLYILIPELCISIIEYCKQIKGCMTNEMNYYAALVQFLTTFKKKFIAENQQNTKAEHKTGIIVKLIDNDIKLYTELSALLQRKLTTDGTNVSTNASITYLERELKQTRKLMFNIKVNNPYQKVRIVTYCNYPNLLLLDNIGFDIIITDILKQDHDFTLSLFDKLLENTELFFIQNVDDITAKMNEYAKDYNTYNRQSPQDARENYENALQTKQNGLLAITPAILSTSISNTLNDRSESAVTLRKNYNTTHDPQRLQDFYDYLIINICLNQIKCFREINAVLQKINVTMVHKMWSNCLVIMLKLLSTNPKWIPIVLTNNYIAINPYTNLILKNLELTLDTIDPSNPSGLNRLNVYLDGHVRAWGEQINLQASQYLEYDEIMAKCSQFYEKLQTPEKLVTDTCQEISQDTHDLSAYITSPIVDGTFTLDHDVQETFIDNFANILGILQICGMTSALDTSNYEWEVYSLNSGINPEPLPKMKLLQVVSNTLNYELFVSKKKSKSKYANATTGYFTSSTLYNGLQSVLQNRIEELTDQQVLEIIEKIFKIRVVLLEIVPNSFTPQAVIYNNLNYLVEHYNRDDTDENRSVYSLKQNARDYDELMVHPSDTSDPAYFNISVKNCSPSEQIISSESDDNESPTERIAVILKNNDNYYFIYNSSIKKTILALEDFVKTKLNFLVWHCDFTRTTLQSGTTALIRRMIDSVVHDMSSSSDAQIGGDNGQGQNQITDKYKVIPKEKVRSKLSFYVAIDLVVHPGKGISKAQKMKYACQMKYDNVLKSWSKYKGTIYMPRPLNLQYSFVPKSDSSNSSDSSDSLNQGVTGQDNYESLEQLIYKIRAENVVGNDFYELMREKIHTSPKFRDAFVNLRAGTSEFDKITSQHKIAPDNLNSLINLSKSQIGGRYKNNRKTRGKTRGNKHVEKKRNSKKRNYNYNKTL